MRDMGGRENREEMIGVYKALCLFLLKRFDEVYQSKASYLPYSYSTQETLLFYLPSLVTDGDLTKGEGERMEIMLKRIMAFSLKEEL